MLLMRQLCSHESGAPIFWEGLPLPTSKRPKTTKFRVVTPVGNGMFLGTSHARQPQGSVSRCSQILADPCIRPYRSTQNDHIRRSNQSAEEACFMVEYAPQFMWELAPTPNVGTTKMPTLCDRANKFCKMTQTR